jgi:hypothetical protein
MPKRIAVRRKARSGIRSPCPAIWRSEVCDEASSTARPGGAVLKRFEDSEKKTLAGRGEQVDAVEISEAEQGCGIGVCDQPFAGVAALETGGGEGRAAEEIAGEGLFSDAVFAFKGGDLNVGRGHVCLGDELAPCGADSDNLCGDG